MKSVKYIVLIAGITWHVNAYAESLFTFYGKLNLAAENINKKIKDLEKNDDTLQNKASRVGFYGNKKVENDHTIFYRLEYGVNIVNRKNKDTFFLRDIYVGMKNDYGKIKLGYSNTPFKLAQKKVDVFNDVVDLATLISGDNVESMILIEPYQFHGITLNVAYLLNDNPNKPKNLRQGFSSSIAYNYNQVDIALAYEKGTAGQDLIRFTTHYQINSWFLGFMFQKNRPNQYFTKSQSSRLVSAKYKFGRITAKLQAIDSNFTEGTSTYYGIDGYDNQSITVGLDYSLSNMDTLMLYSTHGKLAISPQEEERVNVLGLGMKVNF